MKTTDTGAYSWTVSTSAPQHRSVVGHLQSKNNPILSLDFNSAEKCKEFQGTKMTNLFDQPKAAPSLLWNPKKVVRLYVGSPPHKVLEFFKRIVNLFDSFPQS